MQRHPWLTVERFLLWEGTALAASLTPALSRRERGKKQSPWRVLLPFRLLLLVLLLFPALASAHAILLDSQPAARGSVPPGPLRITLRYNSRIDHARSRVTLRAPGGDTVLPIAPGGPEDTLDTQTELAPGDYTLRWQVLAVDGHITRGDVPFSVRSLQARVP